MYVFSLWSVGRTPTHLHTYAVTHMGSLLQYEVLCCSLPSQQTSCFLIALLACSKRAQPSYNFDTANLVKWPLLGPVINECVVAMSARLGGSYLLGLLRGLLEIHVNFFIGVFNFYQRKHKNIVFTLGTHQQTIFPVRFWAPK